MRSVLLRARRLHVVDPDNPTRPDSPRDQPVILTGNIATPTVGATVPAQATAGTAQSTTIGRAPFAAKVTRVTLTPNATITGAATNNRKFALVNKGADGNGTTEIAGLTFGNGTNADDFDARDLTLSVTAANLVVAEGDVLAVVETINGTGLASPGGHVQVDIART